MFWLLIEDTGTLLNFISSQMSLIYPTVVVDEDTGKAAVCDNVYCQFPNGLMYEEYHCINENLFVFEKDVFFNNVDMRRLRTTKLPLPPYEKASLICVSVADRLRLRRNNNYDIPPVFIELVMGWLQGDLTNELWEKITLIPFQVVQHAYKMQHLLSSFFIATAERNEAKQIR